MNDYQLLFLATEPTEGTELFYLSAYSAYSVAISFTRCGRIRHLYQLSLPAAQTASFSLKILAL